jgi:MFS family permease
LLLTGLSTFAVGFVPGYESIGIWGAIILTTVRFIQGLGIGGEWASINACAEQGANSICRTIDVAGLLATGPPEFREDMRWH